MLRCKCPVRRAPLVSAVKIVNIATLLLAAFEGRPWRLVLLFALPVLKRSLNIVCLSEKTATLNVQFTVAWVGLCKEEFVCQAAYV